MEVEVRGAVHAIRQNDKYGRPYTPLSDWKAEVGTIVYRTLNHIELMICGSKPGFRALIWDDKTGSSSLTVDKIMKVVHALENGGYHLELISDIVENRKAGIYVAQDRDRARKNLTRYVEGEYMCAWIRPAVESYLANLTAWWLMFG